ncbi:hypothetical protein BU17DRAFT_77929 [Hysterangium stoloniferum]|nr:hypothetical protein BU17DRAFT_77929 [Hysterangium stoloniferum]
MPFPPGCPPNPNKNNAQPDDWSPYKNRAQFELAELLYSKGQMLAGNIDQLMKIWAMHGDEHGEESPFLNHNDLYKTIDTTTIGDVPWQYFITTYDNEILQVGEVHSWMTAKHTVWFHNPHLLVHNILSNPDFKDTFDTSPYQEHDTNGNWASRHANIITKDVTTHGSMFVPIILGSDKTTVSVATGHTEYWPVYLSIGNIHNNAQWAQEWPSEKKYRDNVSYRKFHRQLLHTSLAKILDPLKTGMTTPEVAVCPDGHYRKVIYGLGPYIANYPEQALLACIVQGWCPKCTAPQNNLNQTEGITLRCQEHTELLVCEFESGLLWDGWGVVGDIVPFTNNFPHADSNELISPDLLHQVIKGTFKDHLVTWVEEYLVLAHGRTQANEILDDIDRRIALVAPFSGLRRFPEGDDLKALMKVWLPAVEGYVPVEMIRTICAFLEFCYIVCWDVIDTQSFSALEEALSRFFRYRIIFEECGICTEGFNVPRQHFLVHYLALIRAFGAPNTLGQMLLTNQQLDKIAACHADFASCGMLADTLISDVEEECRNTGTKLKEKEDNDGGDIIRPSILAEVALTKLPNQIHADPYSNMSPMDDSDDQPPEIDNLIMLYPSAVATYFAPSDLSGIGGMRSECIHATPNWRKEGPHYDTVFVNTNLDEDGMCGVDIACIKQFFSFKCQGHLYPCAAVQWYSHCGNEPDEDTGMWIVEPDVYEDGGRITDIIHLDAIVHYAHLIAVYGNNPLPKDILLCYTLDLFHSYYLNKYIYHHAFEIAF